MKKIIILILSVLLVLSGCGSKSYSNKHNEISLTSNEEDIINEYAFQSQKDSRFLTYVEENVYTELIKELNDSGYFVENVEAIYLSKEYIDELNYNSKTNVFFGYSLSELNRQFSGTKYVFDIGDDGTTIVKPMETITDDTYQRMFKNVLIGSGVIVLCVTVSIVSAPTAPAISVVFAASASTATKFALSSAVLGGTSKMIIQGLETGDWSYAVKQGALAASEGFKWGAISGTLRGGVQEVISLKGGTLHGLSMNEAAKIQMESRYPIDVIKDFQSIDQYNIIKDKGLFSAVINGKNHLIRNIDLLFKDEVGRTNLERMNQGLAALDPSTGFTYEVHHLAQGAENTLAILTREEHRQNGNDAIWHKMTEGLGEVARKEWDRFGRKQFWKGVATVLEGQQ